MNSALSVTWLLMTVSTLGIQSLKRGSLHATVHGNYLTEESCNKAKTKLEDKRHNMDRSQMMSGTECVSVKRLVAKK